MIFKKQMRVYICKYASENFKSSFNNIAKNVVDMVTFI